MQTITVNISKDGSDIKVDAAGYSGSGCLKDVMKVLYNVGKINEEQNKPEYYQKAMESVHARS